MCCSETLWNWNELTDSNLHGQLAEGIWFLIKSNTAKESDFGFWEANEEACKIYSSSTFSGWRTTLRYFEGEKPRGKRTNWFMQEYSITQEELLNKDKIIKVPHRFT